MRGTEYAELAAFVAIAEERNFRRAAARLRLSPSALSHTMRDLEERLGVRLLHRTTRSVSPSDAGTALFAKLSPAFADITRAVEDIHAFRDRPAGRVRINMPQVAAEAIFAPAAGRFARTYPDVRLELAINDAFIDIVAGGFDAGVRLGDVVQRDMVAVRLTPDVRFVVAGSPAYLGSRLPPVTPNDLRDHACISYRFAHSGTIFPWRFARNGELLEVAVDGPVLSNDNGINIAAALEGAGLVLTLEELVAEHIAAGRLIRMLDDWSPFGPGIFLYYPSRRQMAPAFRAVVDFFRYRGG